MNATNQNGQTFTKFTGWAEFIKATTNYNIYVQVAWIGWYAPVTKHGMKKVYDNMKNMGFGQKFQGTIVYVTTHSVQVTFNDIN